MDKSKLPSERAADNDAERQRRIDEKNDGEEKLRRAFASTFNTPDGLIVLDWLMRECQFGEPILGIMQGKIDRDATLYQAMRLNLYLKIRSYLSFNILKEVEYET